MRITPLDVRKQEFKRGMRGYDADEVRAFLVNLADEYEAVLVDNKQLRERLVEQDEKLAEYRNLERTLRDTLMTAEKVTQEARDNARREGEMLLAEARQRVERVLAEGRDQLNELRREALDVHREKEAYLGRFRSFAEAQIQFVEQHRGDFKDLDGRLLDRLDLTTGDVQAAPSLDEDPADPIDAALEAPSSPRPSPSARLADERDEWREYAIETGKPRQAAGEVDRIADAVSAAGESGGPSAPEDAPRDQDPLRDQQAPRDPADAPAEGTDAQPQRSEAPHS
ncbi:DivIVA domain-containing protein [bacterium]|nr:DivIVA domain-containing protein [bacterium]